MSESTSGGTRERIQAVALELFTEQGYEKTSLREIAERLGVTKAALYYHFKSKDDIVNSFVDDRLEGFDELIRAAGDGVTDAAARRELLRRYTDQFFTGQQHLVMRFFERNQTVFKNLVAGQRMRDRVLRLADVLAGPDPSPTARLRATLALFAVSSSWFTLREAEVSDAERRAIVQDVADELLDGIDRDRPGPGDTRKPTPERPGRSGNPHPLGPGGPETGSG